MSNSKRVLIVTLFLSFCLAGCAAKPKPADEQDTNEQVHHDYSDPRDPLESFNRVMFDFNYNVLDKHRVRPVTLFYVNYIPDPAKEGTNNFIRNLDEPSSAVNNLLKGNWDDSARSFSRFLINSTVGFFGVVDVAASMGMPRKLDSFGEVMGKYGVDSGAYLMIPGYGPTTIREEAGDYVDDLYLPLSALTFWHKLVRWGLKGLYSRAQLIEQEQMMENSLDPYGFVKEAYFQYKEFKIHDGQIPEAEPEDDSYLDEFLDE